jgi:serine/threonine protein kinase
MTGNIGTVAWVAPEIFNDKKNYTEKADVYR